MESLDDRIIKSIKKFGRPISTKDLGIDIGIPYQHIDRKLRTLEKYGFVSPYGNGNGRGNKNLWDIKKK